MNTMRTGLLMAALMGLFLAAGYLLGRQQGMVIAFLLAAGMNVFAYWNADKMVLRMHGARQVDRQTAPEFYQLVEDLSQRAGLPMPARGWRRGGVRSRKCAARFWRLRI